MAHRTKRRRFEPIAVEEITFDQKLRKDYLTGFHKRKLQRAKDAKEVAERKARAEKIEERKKLRQERQAELERHVKEVNAYIRPIDDSDDSDRGEEDGSKFNEEWNGLSSDSETEPEPIDHEAEYIDEEKYTTVTVEAMDVTREGLFKAERIGETDSNVTPGQEAPDNSPPANGRSKTEKLTKPKKKRKKFRYESKAERKITRAKEHLRGSNRRAKARKTVDNSN